MQTLEPSVDGEYRLRTIVWAGESRHVAAATDHGTINVWTRTGTLHTTIQVPNLVPSSLALAADGTVVSARTRQGWQLWEGTSGQPIPFHPPVSGQITSLAFAPHAPLLAITMQNTLWIGTARGEGWRRTAIPGTRMEGWYTRYLLTRDDTHRYLATVNTAEAVLAATYPLEGEELIGVTPDGHPYTLKTAANEEGEALLTVWDLARQREVYRGQQIDRQVWQMAIAPEGELITLLVSDGWQTIIEVWNPPVGLGRAQP